MDQRHKRLLKLEKKGKRALEAALLAILLKGSPATNFQLMLKVAVMTRTMLAAIQDIHRGAEDIANRQTLEDDQEPSEVILEPKRTKQVVTAAKSLVLAVIAVAAVRLREGDEDALEGAVEAVGGRIDRIATTETFAAYSAQVLANTQDTPGEWVWDAILDKRTCPTCDGLHGTTWTKQSDVPACPAHARCRCLIEFYPTQ